MRDSALSLKSKKFAVRIVRLFQYLTSEKREFILSKQLLRSGTSIGANIAEATRAVSRADFTAKLFVSAKECAETLYWLDLLYETNYLSQAEYSSITQDCRELERMLNTATKSLQNKH